MTSLNVLVWYLCVVGRLFPNARPLPHTRVQFNFHLSSLISASCLEDHREPSPGDNSHAEHCCTETEKYYIIVSDFLRLFQFSSQWHFVSVTASSLEKLFLAFLHPFWKRTTEHRSRCNNFAAENEAENVATLVAEYMTWHLLIHVDWERDTSFRLSSMLQSADPSTDQCESLWALSDLSSCGWWRLRTIHRSG